MSGKYNFTIEQGTTFTRQITYKDKNDTPINLTGYTAKMQIRTNDANELELLTLTTENGGILIAPTDGKITICIPSEKTCTFQFITAKYDLELTTGCNTIRLIEGRVSLTKEVTR